MSKDASNLPSIFDKADREAARERAVEIEARKAERKLERLKKQKLKERKERLEFYSKLVAPVLLVLTLLISYLIYSGVI